MAKISVLRKALVGLFVLVLASPAVAQVSLPRTTPINNAQPTFSVDPTTGLPVSGGSGGGAVFGPTAVGSPAANPPVVVSGTSDGTATGNVQAIKVDTSGNQYVQGAAASATTASGNPVQMGAVYQSAAPTLTNGQVNAINTDVNGNIRAALTGVGTAYSTGVSSNREFVYNNNAFPSSYPLGVSGYAYNGSSQDPIAGIGGAVASGAGTQAVAFAPTTAAAAGLTPSATTAVASSLVLKASAGNGYRYALTTGASAGFLLVFDATSAPADGTVTPKICRPVAANQSVEVNHSLTPDVFTTGIVEVFSTTGCYTKTASATAAFEGAVK